MCETKDHSEGWKRRCLTISYSYQFRQMNLVPCLVNWFSHVPALVCRLVNNGVITNSYSFVSLCYTSYSQSYVMSKWAIFLFCIYRIWLYIQHIIHTYYIHTHYCSNVQKVSDIFLCFWKKYLMLTKAAFIWSEKKLKNNNNNHNIVKYYYSIIPVMQSRIFSSHYFSLQCHMILQKSF